MKVKYLVFLIFQICFFSVSAQYPAVENDLDKKVKSFLEENASNWRDMNITISDGKILYDLIIQNNYKNVVEIGTSTGHSAIWIAWALSKTGGKLITIEIDKDRYLQAKTNFAKTGLTEFIDARLGDAHDLVPELNGKYDLVFCDADVVWYKNYFTALDPKLEVGGCFVAHNTRRQVRGITEFLNLIESLDNYNTSSANSREGMTLSYKMSENN